MLWMRTAHVLNFPCGTLKNEAHLKHSKIQWSGKLEIAILGYFIPPCAIRRGDLVVTCGNFHVARGDGLREVYETLVLWFDDDWIFDQCKSSPKAHLIGGLEPWNFMTFQKQLGMSSSQLTSRFFRGVAQPPTSHSWGHQHTMSWILNCWCPKLARNIYPSRKQQ